MPSSGYVLCPAGPIKPGVSWHPARAGYCMQSYATRLDDRGDHCQRGMTRMGEPMLVGGGLKSLSMSDIDQMPAKTSATRVQVKTNRWRETGRFRHRSGACRKSARRALEFSIRQQCHRSARDCLVGWAYDPFWRFGVVIVSRRAFRLVRARLPLVRTPNGSLNSSKVRNLWTALTRRIPSRPPGPAHVHRP